MTDEEKRAAHFQSEMEREMTTPEDKAREIVECERCRDQGWVCENHTFTPWGDGDGCFCSAPGSPCPDCNKSTGRDDPPRMPPGTKIIYDRNGWHH